MAAGKTIKRHELLVNDYDVAEFTKYALYGIKG
jgi:hypothetical protein